VRHSFFSSIPKSPVKQLSNPVSQTDFNRCCKILKDESHFWKHNPRLGLEAKKKAAQKLIELLFGNDVKENFNILIADEIIPDQPERQKEFHECYEFLTEHSDIWSSPEFELEVHQYTAIRLVSVLFGEAIAERLEDIISNSSRVLNKASF
jgi:hypothetical protein